MECHHVRLSVYCWSVKISSVTSHAPIGALVFINKKYTTMRLMCIIIIFHYYDLTCWVAWAVAAWGWTLEFLAPPRVSSRTTKHFVDESIRYSLNAEDTVVLGAKRPRQIILSVRLCVEAYWLKTTYIESCNQKHGQERERTNVFLMQTYLWWLFFYSL